MSSAYLTESDRRLLNGVYFRMIYLKKDLEFQFPPKITSDSRKINFDVQTIFQVDPQAIYMGNSARDLTLKIEYIVEDDGYNMNRWTIRRIKENINNLKGITVNGDAKVGDTDISKFAIQFAYPLITGPAPKSLRINSVSVEYSDEMIILNGGLSNIKEYSPNQPEGSPDSSPGYDSGGVRSYPLKSTVTISMSTISQNRESNQWAEVSDAPKQIELWY
jgi:hypothetical protein